MTVVDGVVYDIAGDVTSDVDFVAISVVTSLVTSGLTGVDVSDDSESVVTVIGNVSTLSDVIEVSLDFSSSGNRFVVVIELPGDIIAVVDLTADVTADVTGIDDENVDFDISSGDPVNASVDNAGVVDNSPIVLISVGEIMLSTVLVEVI